MKPRLKSNCRLLVERNHGYIYDGDSGNIYVLNALGVYSLNTIKITGGEPYVRKRLVNKILELSSKIGVQSIIETNGTLLNEKDVVSLKKYKVQEVSISIDFSSARQFDEFRGLKGGYLRILETEEAVRVEENSPGKIGFEHRPFQIARSVCEFKNLLSILPNGDISLCGLDGEHPEAVFGNIRHDSIKEIWIRGNELLDEIRSFEPDKIKGVCKICVFRKYCANLWPALVYEKYGTFLASFPICQELYDSGMFNTKYLIEGMM